MKSIIDYRKKQNLHHVNFFVKLEKENNRSVINMRTQYLHDTGYDNTYAARVTSSTSEGVYIFTATGRKKHAMAAATVQ